MNQYMQFQTATAIEDAANNQGTAGDALGLGAGLGLGMILPQSMMNSFNQSGVPQGNMNSQSSGSDFESKIRSLKTLFEQGLLTEEEYNSKREQVLQDI